MFAPKIWAIDLGRSALKGVLITPVRDGVEILDADIISLKGDPPEALKEPSRDTRLWDALEEFDKRHRIDKYPVAFAVPAQNALIREIEIALVGKRDVEELVNFEASNAIPFVLDEVLWDYHLFDAKGEEATKRGMIFAVKKTSIHTYLQAFAEADAERIVEITTAPLADLSLLQFETEQQGSALLFDVGAENTCLVSMDGNRFWMRNLGIGGNRITWLLRDEFDIPFDQAEQAKKRIARSEMAEDLVEAIKPGLHELAAELKTTLDYLRRQGEDVSYDRVYAIGGAARLTGLKAQVRQSLKKKLQDIRSLEHIFVSPDIDARIIQKNFDRLAVAIGTGIKALDKTPVKASFVPENVARKTQASTAKRFLFSTGIVLWGIVVIAFLLGVRVKQYLKEAQDHAQNVLATYRENKNALRDATEWEAIEREMDFLPSLSNGRAQTALIFDKVVRVFEEANRHGTVYFQLFSMECYHTKLHNSEKAPEDDKKEEERKTKKLASTAETVLSVVGQVHTPPGMENKEAYESLNARLKNHLRNSLLLTRSQGKATFEAGKRLVTGSNTRWSETLKEGDEIMAHEDGIWYSLAKVQSDDKLLLNNEFEGGDIKGEFSAARIGVSEWNHLTGEFTIRAEVPSALPFTGVLRIYESNFKEKDD